jgi:hypothetical protein
MKYVVKNSRRNSEYRETARLMAELRAARRELKAERRKLQVVAA